MTLTFLDILILIVLTPITVWGLWFLVVRRWKKQIIDYVRIPEVEEKLKEQEQSKEEN